MLHKSIKYHIFFRPYIATISELHVLLHTSNLSILLVLGSQVPYEHSKYSFYEKLNLLQSR